MWEFFVVGFSLFFTVCVVAFQTLSLVRLCDPMHCSTPGLPVLHYLPKFAQIHVHWISEAIQPAHPLASLLLLLSVFPSIRAFSVSSSFYVAKYWRFSFITSPSNECSGLISFSVDWFDLLAVQGTLKSLCHHHSSKASTFFMVQLLHAYMTTGKKQNFDYMDLCR